MSDINIFSNPFSVGLIYFIVGTPGIILGATTGALWWRAHKVWGAALGAAVGYGLCLGLVWIYVVS